MLNPFLANVPILFPLKTLENQRFSRVFKRYKMGILARNWLIAWLQYYQFMPANSPYLCIFQLAMDK